MRITTLYRLAQVQLTYLIFVIVWGGFVRASGSGAGCGAHWPMCNGVVVPRAETIETLIELTHRITSGLTLPFAIWLWWQARKLKVGTKAALGTILFLCIEALVGAGLVKLELVADNASFTRAWVMAFHLVNTFLLLTFATKFLYEIKHGASRLKTASVSWWLTAIVMCAMGATGAIAALGDTLFPSDTFAAGLANDFSAEAPLLLKLRMIHPFLSLFAAACLVFISFRSIAAEREELQNAGKLLITACILQMSIGLVNLLLAAPIATQMLHLAFADLVWIALCWLGLHQTATTEGSSQTVVQTP